MEKTELVDWIIDDNEWILWTLGLFIPGVICAILLLPGLILCGVILLILGGIDYVTGLLEKKEEIITEKKKSEKTIEEYPEIVRGVLIEENNSNLKRCTPVIMFRSDKVPEGVEVSIVLRDDRELITFSECDKSFYSIVEVPGNFWYDSKLGVILGPGSREVDKFIKTIKDGENKRTGREIIIE